MTSKLYLAIDQGGQSSRVAVYTEHGEQLHLFSAPCSTYRYHPEDSTTEFIEQDGDEILSGINLCLQQLAHTLGDDVKHIVAAGFAGQGSSLLCWDKVTGKPLSPVLSWQDVRGEELLKEIGLTHQQAQRITGLRVSPHYGASKIRWCLLHNPSVKKAASENRLFIGPIVSFIFWNLLTAANAGSVDPGHAQRTLLWNLQQCDWDQSLLDAFQVSSTVLPRCLAHNSDFGFLTVGAVKIPMRASSRDQGASLFARGMPNNNACYINIGTGAFIQRVTNDLQAPEGLLVSPLWLPENKKSMSLYAWEATVNGAAAAIPYMQEQTHLDVAPEDIQRALAQPSRGYFLNAIGGLSAPYWRTDLQSYFSDGLTADEKITAWIESVIFQIVVNVMIMHERYPISTLVVSGGFSRADQVCQKLADLTQMSVHRSENSDATLQGIAYMASGLSAQWNNRVTEEIFMPQHNPSLLNAFRLWQIALQQWVA